MDIFTVFLIATGLAMDAFAVSVARGFAMEKLHVRNVFRIAFFFGLFQFLMPIVGWFCGVGLRSFITNIDHWIAFGLLCFIGAKMIYESTKLKEEGDEKSGDITIYVLLGLSIATSIDALAVGLSLSFMNVPIILPSVIVGVVTFILSFAGVIIGDKFGHVFESKIETVGGLILIGIGIKILVQHLLSS